MATVEYYNNSNKSKNEDDVLEVRDIKKVVTGSVKRKKKSTGKKMLETFFSEDIQTVKNYIISDVIIPYIKNILSESFNAALFGQNGRRAGTYYSAFGGQKTNYQRCYGNPQQQSVHKENFDYDNIIYGSYVDADKVLSGLKDICVEYPKATIGDLKMLLGETTTPADYAWGWNGEMMDSASITHYGDGYIIRMPRPIKIK